VETGRFFSLIRPKATSFHGFWTLKILGIMMKSSLNTLTRQQMMVATFDIMLCIPLNSDIFWAVRRNWCMRFEAGLTLLVWLALTFCAPVFKHSQIPDRQWLPVFPDDFERSGNKPHDGISKGSCWFIGGLWCDRTHAPWTAVGVLWYFKPTLYVL
jgi:hypothetical protein